MSNFDFLKDYDEKLYKLGNRIEKEVNTSPSAVKADATPFLQHILDKLLNLIGKNFNSRKDFYTQLDAVYRAGKISYKYKQLIYSAYQLRNKIHDDLDEIEKNEFVVALQIHEKLFYIAKKFYRDYNDNYDEYKGTPLYKPIELDTSDDEIELVKVPDFADIIDITYDYCVICGEPNHSNYSICCEKCNRVMDNANNFISIRNSFGKNARFTKEDLIEYGIAEGYANQLIHQLVQDDMLKVKGRFITFNNMHFDEYLSKIDNYISVCELITKFREDKITPADIKQTKQYKQGSFHQEPFYQFYKIINEEIVDKFERDLLATENIWESIDYTTITQNELKRWYLIQLASYNKGKINESFEIFNNSLMAEYIDLKRNGVLEKDIQKQLNIAPDIYEFFSNNYKEFIDEINQIKRDLIIKAIKEGKTKEEIIEYAGVTPKEYENLVKVSDFNNDELSKIRNSELDKRKENLVSYLKENDLPTACSLAKISIDDFYQMYEKNMTSDFYLNATKVLMDNFLNQRKNGKTKAEATEIIGIEPLYVDHWFNRTLTICEEFKNRHIKVTVDLIHEGFESNKSKKEISKFADISVNRIDTYLNLGKRGYGTYKPLYDFYEENIIPIQLSRFLDEIKNKPIKKALELSELSEDEFRTYCNMGKNGDERFAGFYQEFYNIKLSRFLKNISKGKDKPKALKNSYLTEKELDECYELGKNGDERFNEFYQKFYEMKIRMYIRDINKGKAKSQALKNSYLDEEELQDDIDEIIFDRNMDAVMKSLLNDSTTKQAAINAGIKIDVIYEWFLKGRRGDDKLEEFSQYYYKCYILPGSLVVQSFLREGIPLNEILKDFKDTFTREDYNFWSKHGFLVEATEKLDAADDEKALIEEIFEESKEYEKNL